MRIRLTSLSLACSSLFAAPPVAVNEAFTTAEDVVISRNAVEGLRANDSPGTATEPAAGLVTSPAHGTIVLSPDGAFTFTPALNYHGLDSFTYKVFGDRPVTAFAIDEANSTLTVGATLRITFQACRVFRAIRPLRM